MNKSRLLLLVLLAAVAFSVGHGTTANAFHSSNTGYFHEQSEGGGWWNVWPSWGGSSGCAGTGLAIPKAAVYDAQSFINFTLCKLGGNTQEHVGAAFIISTMTGMKNLNPGAAEINEFDARVKYAALQGWVNFNGSDGCSQPNTFYQSNRHDVAYYWGCATGPPDAIVFNTPNTYYVIKRFCANPVGDMSPIPDNPQYNMSGRSTVTNLTSGARGSNPFPGDRLQFQHFVRNNGPGSSWPFSTIWWVAERTSPAPGGVVGGAADGGYYAAGEEKRVNVHEVVIPAGTVPNTQFCERVGYDPINGVGGRNGRGANACATVAYNFNLTPTVSAVINGVSGPVTGTIAEPGDTVTFTYAINNTGTTLSQNITCTYRQATHAGFSTAAPTTVFTPAGANCPPARTFPPGVNTTTAVEAGVVAGANTSICRSLTISPVTQSGGNRVVQSCIQVATKPYARVYGGDVSVGGGLAVSPDAPTSCTRNNGAAVIGWNRRASGGYAGAGVQFATYAMGVIFDTASSLGNPGGAVPPTSLSFANNNIDVASGRFGGSYASTPCASNYYDAMPTSPTTLGATTSVSGLDGSYSRTGSLQLDAGSVGKGKKVNIYVDGNLYIKGDTTYGDSGAWTSGSIPMLRVVVRGNIYIDHDVTQLEGLYIAQPKTDGTDGIIYTCTLSAAPLDPDGLLNSRCTQKLTVYGSFVARQVRLLRVNGTLRQGSPASGSNDPLIAEVFVYTPMLWISQPSEDASSAQYDSITSLPPVL